MATLQEELTEAQIEWLRDVFTDCPQSKVAEVFEDEYENNDGPRELGMTVGMAYDFVAEVDCKIRCCGCGHTDQTAKDGPVFGSGMCAGCEYE